MDKLKQWSEAEHGRVAALAKALGVDNPVAWRYCKGIRKVPAVRVIDVEGATGIPRHELRPDIYPAPQGAA